MNIDKKNISKAIFQVGEKYVTLITKDNKQIKYVLKLDLKKSIRESTRDDIFQTKQCKHLRNLNFYTKNGITFKHIKQPVFIRMHNSEIHELFYKNNSIKFLVITKEELFGEWKKWKQ